jgi:hypothetical protein
VARRYPRLQNLDRAASAMARCAFSDVVRTLGVSSRFSPCQLP